MNEESNKKVLDKLNLFTVGIQKRDLFKKQPPHMAVVSQVPRINLSTSFLELLLISEGDMLNVVQSSINRFVFFVYKTENNVIGKPLCMYKKTKQYMFFNKETAMTLREIFRLDNMPKYRSHRLMIDYTRPIRTEILGEKVTAYSIYDIPSERKDLSEEDKIEYENDMKEAFSEMRAYFERFNKKDKLITV